MRDRNVRVRLHAYSHYGLLGKFKVEINASFENTLARYQYVNIKKPAMLLNLLGDMTTIPVFSSLEARFFSIVNSMNVHI